MRPVARTASRAVGHVGAGPWSRAERAGAAGNNGAIRAVAGNAERAPRRGHEARDAFDLGPMGQAFTWTRVARVGKTSDSGAARRRCNRPSTDRISIRAAPAKAANAAIIMICPIFQKP
jgi:hypothetical protein